MKHSQKSHSSDRNQNMTVVLFTLLSVLICGSLALSLKAQTKTSDEHVTLKPVPGRNGKIAFTRTRDGDDGDVEIYTIEADGSNQTRLTNNPGYDHSRRWSPDGTKIAFESKRDNDEEIYLMNADGSNQTRLTNNPGYDYSPIFSPDGTRIAFGSRRDNNVEIYVMNADGSNQTRLTNDPADDYSHAWSPDSFRIAFARGGNIYVMNADGTNQTRLTTGGSDAFPRWSPDGARIVFTSGGGTGSAGISVMNADGSNQTRLTNRPFSYYNSLDWSPDGSRIAFVNNPDNNNYNYEIYVMNADGSNQTRLTNNSAYDHSPIFSPDGTRFAFLSDRDKIDNGWDYNNKIYVMNADGSSQTRLTNTADNVYEFEPDWQALPQAAANPIDTVDFFVRQQYRDFLNREPDTPGLAHWAGEITACDDPSRRQPGETLALCIERKRTNTSAAFFLSPEFQYTGYFVYRLYKGSLIQNGAGRFPTYQEFLRDVRQVASGIIQNNQLSAAAIEQNKKTFAEEFTKRAEFRSLYDPLSNFDYVERLFQTTGISVSVTEKQALVNGLNNQTETRASVLQKVVDGAVVIAEGNQQFTTAYGRAFYDKEFNAAFVLMQYFGYLRRDPDPAGYQNWLDKLNTYGNYIDAEMVKSFITSPEYRARFSQP